MTLEDRLRGWTGPSSDTEQEKQARTERMVREAIDAHQAFQGYQMAVYAKGSYPNNTNVRTESDVDIAVQCSDVIHWQAAPGVHVGLPPYQGHWTPSMLRTEVINALRAKFHSQVDTTGRVAIKVNSSTARVDADVVPCFNYRYYLSAGQCYEGAMIYRTDESAVINYPQYHLSNGKAKNIRTNHSFKKVVRILKRTANEMAAYGVYPEIASCLIECLVYNCPDIDFIAPPWTEAVKRVIAHIWNYTESDAEPLDDAARWREVDGCKYLFDPSQSWSRRDARDLGLAVWSYLGLAQA